MRRPTTPTCALVAVVLAVVVATLTEDVHALTAFGKSGDKDKEAKPVPKVPKGRECKKQEDCAGTPSTTCRLSEADGKKRCVCPDGQAPINSKCAVVLLAPGKPCRDTSECVLNAECTTANDTRRRECSCKDGFDYQPDIDDACNGCGRVAVWPCVVTLFLTILVMAVAEPRPHSVRST